MIIFFGFQSKPCQITVLVSTTIWTSLVKIGLKKIFITRQKVVRTPFLKNAASSTMNQLKNILWQDEPSFLVVIVSVFLKRYLVYIYIVHTKCKAFIRNHQIRMAVKLFSLQLSLSDMTLKKKILCTPLMKWFHEKWHGFFCVFILLFNDFGLWWCDYIYIFCCTINFVFKSWFDMMCLIFKMSIIIFSWSKKILDGNLTKKIILLLCVVNNFTWNDTVTVFNTFWW